MERLASRCTVFGITVDYIVYNNIRVLWHRGAVGRTSDLRSRGYGFESWPGTWRKNSEEVYHTL